MNEKEFKLTKTDIKLMIIFLILGIFISIIKQTIDGILFSCIMFFGWYIGMRVGYYMFVKSGEIKGVKDVRRNE